MESKSLKKENHSEKMYWKICFLCRVFLVLFSNEIVNKIDWLGIKKKNGEIFYTDIFYMNHSFDNHTGHSEINTKLLP